MQHRATALSAARRKYFGLLRKGKCSFECKIRFGPSNLEHNFAKDDQMNIIKEVFGHCSWKFVVLCSVVGTIVFLVLCHHDIIPKSRSEKQNEPTAWQKISAPKQHQRRLRPLARSVAPVPHDARPRPVGAVPPETRAALSARPAEGAPPMSPAEAASGKSQLMDDLLDRAEIPSDYGETMTALFRRRRGRPHWWSKSGGVTAEYGIMPA